LTRRGDYLRSEKFEYSKDVTDKENKIHSLFKDLENLHSKKKPYLEDALERELYKEETYLFYNEHVLIYEDFKHNWYPDKKNYSTTEIHIDTLPAALDALNIVRAFAREKDRYIVATVEPLKQLGELIKARSYHKLSDWEFPDGPQLDEHESTVDSHIHELTELTNNKTKRHEDDVTRERHKEKLRLLFSSQASNFKAFQNDVVTSAVVTHFGFTLKEVEHFQQELDKLDSQIQHDANTKREEYEDTNRNMNEYNIRDNVYTTITMDDLNRSQISITDALGNRRKRYQTELERQRFDDQLCQKFASLVDPLSKFIVDGKEAITSAKGNLEEQLQLITHKLSTREEDGHVLGDINKLYAQIEGRNITHNEHTSLTVKDIEVQWEQYKIFLENKEKQIKDEIELERLRGLTPEDLKEIEDNFKQFDKNHNGFLETGELKTLLYSLGEERSKAQIEEFVQKFGDGKKLLYQQFFELMVQLLGDSDTLDEVILGFRLINKTPEGQPPVASPVKLSKVMEDQFVHYIIETGHTLGDGIDFVQWTQQIFSR